MYVGPAWLMRLDDDDDEEKKKKKIGKGWEGHWWV